MRGTSTTMKRKPAVRLINEMPRRPRERNYQEVEPDEWDIELLNEAEKENDGSVISIEQLAEELGVAL